MRFGPMMITGAIAVGILGGASVAKAQSCSQDALEIARALAQEYCRVVRDAADDGEARRSHQARAIRWSSECTRAHSAICRNHMWSRVSRNRSCARLYRRNFDFTLVDEFGGRDEETDSKSYYEDLMLDGCRLHDVDND